MLTRRRASRAGGSMHPSAMAWIAAVGGANVSEGRGRMISATIQDLETAGLWADIDFLPVLTAENEASALVDWKALKAMTVINAPTFTADRGYAFSSSGINTGFVPSTDCVSGTGTNFMMGVYERTDVSIINRAMGALVTTAQSAILTPRNSANAVAGLNASGVNVVTSLSDSRGLTVAQKVGTNGAGFKNGVAGATPALTSSGSTLVNIALFLGGYNVTGTLTSARASTLGYALFGGGNWTADQHLAFYNIMQRYMVALGANV